MSRKRTRADNNINALNAVLADEKKVPEQLQEPRKRFFPFFNARSAEITKQMWVPSKTNTVTVPLHRYEPALRRRNIGWFHFNCQTSKQTLEQISTNKSNNSTLQPMLCSLFAPRITIKKKRTRSLSIDHCSKLRFSLNKWKRQKLNDNKPQPVISVRNLAPAKENQPKRSFKIRVYPTSDQKAILANWFGAVRFVYNNCIAFINDRKPNDPPIKIKTLRDKFVNKQALQRLNPDLLKIPYDIR